MKKVILIGLTIFWGLTGLAFAQMQEGHMMAGQEKKEQMGMMSGQPCMMGQMPMTCPHCGKMGQKQMMCPHCSKMGQKPMMCPHCSKMGQAGMMHGMMGGMGGECALDPPMRHERMMHRHRILRPSKILMMADELGLNEKQVEGIHDIKLNLKKEMLRKKADHGIAKVEAHAMLEKDTIDLKAVKGKIEEAASLAAKMKIAKIEAFIDIKKLLTDEQWKKLKKMVADKAGMATPQHCSMCKMGEKKPISKK